MKGRFFAVAASLILLPVLSFAGVEITGVKWQTAVSAKGSKARFSEAASVSVGKKSRKYGPVRLVLSLSNSCSLPAEGLIVSAAFSLKLSTAVASEEVDAVPFAVDEIRIPKIKAGQVAEVVVAVRDLDSALRRALNGGLLVRSLRVDAMIAPVRDSAELPKVYRADLNVETKED